MPSAQVLVVDDDRGVLDTLNRMLLVLGHTVRIARSAVEGLAAMTAMVPDVVLLDLRMRGITGFDALPHFRHHHPDVPVIVMTAVVDSETIRLAQQEGAFDVLSKPFGLAELEELLDRATRRRVGHDATPPDRRLCSRCGEPIHQGDSVANLYTGTIHIRCVPS